MENIFIKKISEGQIVPRWYLPVYKEDYAMVMICVFFLFAPTVLVIHIIKNIWFCLWRDLFYWNTHLKKHKEAK